MYIRDTKNERDLSHVSLGLTDGEAAELRDTLSTLLAERDRQAERHEHVSSSDYQTELTVYLVRE